MEKENFISVISEAFANGELSLFLGAGGSIDAQFPTWKDLLTPCAIKLGLDINDISDYFQLAQYFINEFGERELYNIINTSINKYHYDSELIQNIVQIGFKSIWTTNFDKVIEKNFENNSININAIHDEVDLSSVNLANRVNIFKLNGDITNLQKIVISKSDIENYQFNHELFLSFFQRELVTNTFLFIGYSFNDDIVLHSIKKLQKYLGNSKKFFYSIMIDRPKDKSFKLFIADLEARYNIKVLLVNSSKEINEILHLIKYKIISKNIFISGSLDSPELEVDAYNLSKAICEKIIDSNYNIVTGFGKNIGYYVSGSSLQKLYANNESNIDKRLIMRPFAHDMSTKNDTSFRKKLIANTKFIIVLYGQALDNKGRLVNSRGVLEEVKISKEDNNFIIPIGSTGYAADEVAQNIKENLIHYPYLENYIERLCNETSPEILAKLILDIINNITNSII